MSKPSSYNHLVAQFVPEHYDLTFELDEKNLHFSGSARITGSLPLSQPTARLHAKDLVITSAKLGEASLSVEMKTDTDELIVTLPRAMQGPVVFDLQFSGKISEQMHGIYVCNFEVEGQKKRIIATQFESHHAREAFPCIDEPAAKATFSVSVGTDKALPIVLGNMPVDKDVVENEKTITSFETTPRMSPYLLAFVAGELHCIEGETPSGVQVRNWAHVGIDKEQLRFSLDHAIRSIEFFNEYFGTDYPLAKCDNVALPDFEFAAMENWGLVTYRETVLLSDPENRSHEQERYCAMVVSHELSHQWFGNLVTMQWWDDLWLNESFASIMEFVALDALYPDWQMWEHFVVDDALRAVTRDVLPGIQSVGVTVNHPDEIHSLFDPSIVYAKGSRLLNMLRCYISDELLGKGLQLYFQRHAYQNTSREDLWAALGEVTGHDISALMTPWLTQSNLPLLRVDRSDNEVKLQQDVFTIGNGEENDRLWPIPLFADPQLESGILLGRSQSFATAEMVRFNAGAAVHTIVHYEKEADRKQIGAAIANRELPAPDRSNSLHDLVLLARGGAHSIGQAMAVVVNCGKEDRAAVWQSIAYVLSAAQTVAEGNEHLEAKLKTVSWQLVNPVIDRLGLQKSDDDATNENEIRNTALAIASHSDASDLIDAMRPCYEQYKNDWSACDADLRPLVMAIAIEHHFKGAFENLLDIVRDRETRPDIHQEASMSLTSTRDGTEITELISLLQNQEVIRQQDLTSWFSGLMGNQYSRAATWQWLVREWPWVEENFAETASYDRFPRICAATMKTSEELADYKAFFEPKLGEISLKRNIEIGINDIAARVAWRDRDQSPLLKWFAKNTQVAGSSHF
jgi:aminopeptidase N